MESIMQFLQSTFGPLVLVFTVFNLGAMGLQVKMPEVMVTLKNKKSLGCRTCFWVSNYDSPAIGRAF
jgi:hypothetical protein